MGEPLPASPDCPSCGWPPANFGGIQVSNICSNPNCNTFAWNPDKTPAAIRSAQPTIIDLEGL